MGVVDVTKTVVKAPFKLAASAIGYTAGTKPGKMALTGLKWLGITGAIAAAAAGVGMWAAHARDARKRESLNEANDVDLQSLERDMLAMRAQQVQMSGPADGRMQNEWQMRVAAARGQQIGPVNPRADVADGATDLGQVRG